MEKNGQEKQVSSLQENSFLAKYPYQAWPKLTFRSCALTLCYYLVSFINSHCEEMNPVWAREHRLCTSISDDGWDWQARTALSKLSSGGITLAATAENWDKEEWQRWTPESNSFSSTAKIFGFVGGVSGCWQPDITAWPSLLVDVTSIGFGTLRSLPLGVSKGEFSLLSLAVGDTEVTCWSKAFRYNERRYCSK